MTAVDVPVSSLSQSHRATRAPDGLLSLPVWSDADVAAADLPIIDSQLVSVGGGLGSFALIDVLRIAGVETERLRVLGPTLWPDDSYRYLCESSGLSTGDRLRSGARIDNIWGFPSYALQTAWRERDVRAVLRRPPTSGQVNAAIRREAARIGWSAVHSHGSVRVLRRRLGGGYFALLDSVGGALAYRSEFVHLAVGYPALRFLPQLREFRAHYGDNHRFVHVYEPHEHVYRMLVTRPGTVLVRGVDVAASRVLRRLIEDRDAYDAPTRIVHLFTDADDRARFLRTWKSLLERGVNEGWYVAQHGQLDEVIPDADGRLLARGLDAGGGRLKLGADFVIDATGLDGDVSGHQVLADLLAVSGARRGELGRLEVSQRFEVLGTRNGSGRIYASGPIAMSELGTADSFSGLVGAAWTICAELAQQGFCDRLGLGRSVVQWMRWLRGRSL
jgi:hypothetical protein